ncbi:response regulator [Deinococcus apachensis]|uniref:response regulator n=1 Tax=Deinococcus apachensis TaxID=309886 RepID=UPI00037EB39F|nr:response regulator [Deinococcus apachensis]
MTSPAFPKHLLLVEDNEHDVELARAALEESEVRCEVTVARDGQEALDLLRGAGSQPDLVLLDLNMPRVSGHEVLRAVKGDAALRHVPVVVFTTSNEASDRDACAAAGADDYVLKPGRFEGLVEAVNRLGRRWLTPTFCV